MNAAEKLKRDCAIRKAWRVEMEEKRAISEAERPERNRESSRKYYQKNAGKIKERHKEHYLENREGILAKSSKKGKERLKMDKKYREKRQATGRAYQKKQANELTDRYLINMLTNGGLLTKEDIPEELIELKRTQIKLQRGLTDVKNNK